MNLMTSSGNLPGQTGITGASFHIQNRCKSFIGKKKQLNYNPRELSAQILRASKSRSASEVLVRARSKVGVLERCLVTGQYNEREVRVALAHAKRMVKCARMKVSNLKEEERLQNRNKTANQTEEQKKEKEIKRRVNSKKQKLRREAENELQKMQQVQKQKARNKELQQKRRMHRMKEREKINEADMKYLKGDTGDEMVRQPVSSYPGVILEASAQIFALDAQVMQQIEQEAEQETEQEIAIADGFSDSVAGTGRMETTAACAPAEAESIDISV